MLLDTHVVIWWIGERGKVSQRVRDCINDPANEIIVSAATTWEMAIKEHSGRLPTASAFLDRYDILMNQLGWLSLPIHPSHGIAAARLPGLHKDPFDRMLAAQALREGLTLATRDPVFAAYGVQTVW